MSGPRLSIIPAGAIFDRSLEPRDLQVIALLGCHIDKAGWCRRSQVKMAAKLGCGRASVQRSLDRLSEAGWVQKKRPPWSSEGGQPSHSYMYRVVLDRDDLTADGPDDADDATDESYAETATDEGECPPVGTPPAQPDGHPGAQPYAGTGAHTYVGTKNVPLERPPIERERDARARADKTARFIAAFEQRWPTSVADDRHRTAFAAEALSEADQDAALNGIGAFLEDLQRHKRKTVPAGWRYLEQRRWDLLKRAAEAQPAAAAHAVDSREGRALIALFTIAGLSQLFRATRLRRDGMVYQRMVFTPRLLALAELPPRDDWPLLTRQQAASWEALLREALPPIASRQPLREGARAPWAWPPTVEGKVYTPTGPPIQPAVSEDDLADFR